jgi:hypothetical protein
MPWVRGCGRECGSGSGEDCLLYGRCELLGLKRIKANKNTKIYTYPLTPFTPRHVLTLQTLAAAPVTTSAVAMSNALSEYRAPLKLPSSSTLDTGEDASPEGARNTLPAFANGVVCPDALTAPREDRGITEGTVIPSRCCRGGGARLLTGGEKINLDIALASTGKMCAG